MKKFLLFIVFIAIIIGVYFGFKTYTDNKVQEEQAIVNDVITSFVTSIYTGNLEAAETYVSDDFDIYDKVFLGTPKKLVDTFVDMLPDDNFTVLSQTNINEFDSSFMNIYKKFEGNTIIQDVELDFDPEIYNKILSFLNIDNQTLTSTIQVSVQKIAGTWQIVDFAYTTK